jgi:deoxyribodipyrimidine photo-lyase
MNNDKSQANNLNKIGILWFRNDLRVQDNSILNYTIEMIKEAKLDFIIPFFCYDIDQLDGFSREAKIERCGPIRRNFIIECVDNLKFNLSKLLKSNLFISYGKPELEIAKLIDILNASDKSIKLVTVISSKEVVTDEITIENSLRRLLLERNITLNLVWDLTMIHLDDIPYNLTRDTLTFFTKSAVIDKDGNYNVRPPVLLPQNYSLPTYDPTKKTCWKENLISKSIVEPQNKNKSAVLNLKGGEDEAIKRLEHYFFILKGLKNYKQTRNGLIGVDYSSKLSLWLAYGCISARFIYSKIKLFEKNNGSNNSTRQFSHFFLFRDYLKYYSYCYGRKIFFLNSNLVDDLEDYNDLLEVSSSFSALSIYEKKKWNNDRNAFEKWCKGETGYPFIDANMKELNETGYMSNRGRQNVASFLAKDMEFDWRWGAEYFEKTLIDFDCAINWYMWRWCSGVGDGLSTEWHFNNVKQAYDYDFNGDYVRMWLPQLENVPIEYIHSPFRMSMTDQRRYKCVIGKDYPPPIIRIKNEWKQMNYDKAIMNKSANSSKPKKSEFERFNDF